MNFESYYALIGFDSISLSKLINLTLRHNENRVTVGLGNFC